MPRALPALLLAAAVLCGCAAAPKAAPPAPPPATAPDAPAPQAATTAPPATPADDLTRYRCDNGVDFTVRFGADSAVVDAGPQGRDELLRDAGGVTPQQTVYSDERLRAEFGLGPNGREALLNYAQPPLVARCTRVSQP